MNSLGLVGGTAVKEGKLLKNLRGPRFKTKIIIRMMFHFSDIAGMTMPRNTMISEEQELAYAMICSVADYGHGLTYKPLNVKETTEGTCKNAHIVLKIINNSIERMDLK